jgi:flavin-binding protein dodecin
MNQVPRNSGRRKGPTCAQRRRRRRVTALASAISGVLLPLSKRRILNVYVPSSRPIDFAIREQHSNQSMEANMDSHIYRVIELVGTSEKGIDDAVRMAIERAHKTIRNLRWFEIALTSGHIEDGKVQHFQVTLKVGFTMEDAH